MAHAGHAAPHVGHDVHDRAAVLVHPLREAFPRTEKAAGQVGPDDRLPALLRDAGERRGELAAGVVDQPVDAAGALQRPRPCPHPLLVPDVAGDRIRDAAGIGDSPHALEPIALVPTSTTVAPRLAARGAATDPAAAGDDVRLPCEQDPGGAIESNGMGGQLTGGAVEPTDAASRLTRSAGA
jgi:hypothetical protein